MANKRNKGRKGSGRKKKRAYRKPVLTKHGALNADVAAFSVLY